jgi:hypothetical protein
MKNDKIFNIHKSKPWRFTIFSMYIHYNMIDVILNYCNPNSNIDDFIKKIVIFR